jgi:light-regulated signal transduction histidine kinase (bacteriophytochrome)
MRLTGNREIRLNQSEADTGPTRPTIIYGWFIGLSILAVLAFALFQHLLVLGIPLLELRPAMLVVPMVVGGVFGYLLARIRILHARTDAQLHLIQAHEQQLREEIETRRQTEISLDQKRQALEIANDELRAFSYSVSHDLRAPLRTISGFSSALAEDCAGQLDETSQEYLKRIQGGCLRMEQMIEGLLTLARVTQTDMSLDTVPLSDIARGILEELAEQEPERRVEPEIQAGLSAHGDRRLLTVALENLLQNAWKFTTGRDQGRIRLYRELQDGKNVFCIDDNGAGFDMRYARDLFTPFTRLHQQTEFPGSGIGLATAQRVIVRHGGRIWAEGKVDEGARFCFTLS